MGQTDAKLNKLNSRQLAEYVASTRKKSDNEVPAFISRNFDIDKSTENKYRCYRLRPKVGFDGKYIFYIYGSSLCREISKEQWIFIEKLARETGCGVYIPLYPLAPENCCEDVFDMLIKAYSNFRMSIDVNRTILLGDAAGGGLALSLALLAWQEGYKKPDQLILLSPEMDTEFFDKDMESKLRERALQSKTMFFNDSAKNFINEYWVKDYAVKMAYTSPFYEDYTDICDDVVIFSGTGEPFFEYSCAFYNKAKKQGVNVRFYEFEAEEQDFVIKTGTKEREKAYSYLKDVIKKSYDSSLKDIYMVKLVADWSKKYPELIKSDSASKFIYDNKFDFKNVAYKMGEYKNIVMAASYSACDEKVRKYIMEFPNCTVVQVGCLMDDMFSRLDNGRIHWYSVGSHTNMSVRRALYGVREREFTIGRNIMDFSWIDDISCVRKQGVIFVFNDTLSAMRSSQVKRLFEKILEKFSGAELVFTTTTNGARILDNIRRKKVLIGSGKRHFAVEDAHKLMGEWRPEYKVKSENTVFKVIQNKKNFKLLTRIGIAYNNMSFSHKIVHLKLGGEVYEITV